VPTVCSMRYQCLANTYGGSTVLTSLWLSSGYGDKQAQGQGHIDSSADDSSAARVHPACGKQRLTWQVLCPQGILALSLWTTVAYTISPTPLAAQAPLTWDVCSAPSPRQSEAEPHPWLCCPQHPSFYTTGSGLTCVPLPVSEAH
jgi:hypothetical protein